MFLYLGFTCFMVHLCIACINTSAQLCPCDTSLTNSAALSVVDADSLRFTSALSIGLAVIFLVIAGGISIIKIISGNIGMPRLFPVITDVDSVFDLFTVVPVLMTAYICHYNGMKLFETFA